MSDRPAAIMPWRGPIHGPLARRDTRVVMTVSRRQVRCGRRGHRHRRRDRCRHGRRRRRRRRRRDRCGHGRRRRRPGPLVVAMVIGRLGRFRRLRGLARLGRLGGLGRLARFCRLGGLGRRLVRRLGGRRVRRLRGRLVGRFGRRGIGRIGRLRRSRGRGLGRLRCARRGGGRIDLDELGAGRRRPTAVATEAVSRQGHPGQQEQGHETCSQASDHPSIEGHRVVSQRRPGSSPVAVSSRRSATKRFQDVRPWRLAGTRPELSRSGPPRRPHRSHRPMPARPRSPRATDPPPRPSGRLRRPRRSDRAPRRSRSTPRPAAPRHGR